MPKEKKSLKERLERRRLIQAVGAGTISTAFADKTAGEMSESDAADYELKNSINYGEIVLRVDGDYGGIRNGFSDSFEKTETCGSSVFILWGSLPPEREILEEQNEVLKSNGSIVNPPSVVSNGEKTRSLVIESGWQNTPCRTIPLTEDFETPTVDAYYSGNTLTVETGDKATNTHFILPGDRSEIELESKVAKVKVFDGETKTENDPEHGGTRTVRPPGRTVEIDVTPVIAATNYGTMEVYG